MTRILWGSPHHLGCLCGECQMNSDLLLLCLYECPLQTHPLLCKDEYQQPTRYGPLPISSASMTTHSPSLRYQPPSGSVLPAVTSASSVRRKSTLWSASQQKECSFTDLVSGTVRMCVYVCACVRVKVHACVVHVFIPCSHTS